MGQVKAWGIPEWEGFLKVDTDVVALKVVHYMWWCWEKAEHLLYQHRGGHRA